MAKEKETPTIYQKEKEYREKIAPLLKEIKIQCELNKIPFFFIAAVANSEKGTKYVRDGLMTGSHSIHLANDEFEKHLGVCCGFDVYPPGTKTDFTEEELMNYILSGALPDELETVEDKEPQAPVFKNRISAEPLAKTEKESAELPSDFAFAVQ